MKNKGFTLTELLVVVVILGIISGMAVPLIRGLSNIFERKKYSSYKDSMIVASKLYNDSYSEDLFGHNENGCAYITFDQLVDRNLLKDIDIQGVSCNSDKTYVRVTKQKDKYMYVGYLACGEKTDGKIQDIDVSLPSFIPDKDNNACTGVDPSTIVIGATKEKSEEYNKKKKSTKLTLTSYTGIDTKNSIYVKWSQDENAYNSDDGWEKVTFKIAGNQQEKIDSGDLPIVSTSKELITPTGDSSDGSWILFVRVDQLKDIYGNKWVNPDKEKPDSKYVSFQPFNVDTVAPVISNLAVTSTDSNYNSENVNVTFTGTDNHSTAEELKMCIATDSNGCKNASDFEPYTSSKNKTLDTSGSASKTVYVYLKDKAGNVSSSTKQYSLEGFVRVYYNACDIDGKNCSQFDTKTLKGTYGASVTITPPAKNGYKAPSAVTKNYGGNHTLTFNYTQNYSFTNFGNRGNRFTGYTVSADDEGITVSYSGGGTMRLWATGASGGGEEPSNYFSNGSKLKYSDINSASGPTHNKQYGSYFVISNNLALSSGNNLELRPIVRVYYYDGSTQIAGPVYKKPNSSFTTLTNDSNGVKGRKSGYELAAWQVYSYDTTNGINTWTACDQLVGSEWKKTVYFEPGFTITNGAWNLSNSSYPCPRHYGYSTSNGYLTVRLVARWQKVPVADYK